jgi:hypothetical protein
MANPRVAIDEEISSDPNQALMVVGEDGKILGTWQLICLL